MRKIKLFLLTLFIGSSLHALTLSDLRTNTRVLTKDTYTSRQRFTDAQYNEFLNEAQADVLNNTWAVSKSSSISLVSGTTCYTIPTDLIAISRITLENKNLDETSLIKLDGDNGNSNWLLSAGLPQNYYQDPTRTDQICMYPFPNTSASTGTLRVQYYSRGTDMSSDSDIPFNSEYRFFIYHRILEYYAAFRVYLLEGEQDKATLYRQEYEARLQLMIQSIGKKPNYLPGVSGNSKSR